jgi:hypothetical protein
MDEHVGRFTAPVIVKSENPTGTVAVEDSRQACEQLLGLMKRGPKWRKASTTCGMAVDGIVPPAQCRRAFEAAAREAGVLVKV